MKNEAARLNLNSSRTGSQWLQQLKSVALNDVGTSDDMPEILVVQFPDLRSKSPAEIDATLDRLVGRKQGENRAGRILQTLPLPADIPLPDTHRSNMVTPDLLAAIAEAENLAASAKNVAGRSRSEDEAAVVNSPSMSEDRAIEQPLPDATVDSDISAPPETWQPEPTQKPAERKKENDDDDDQSSQKDVDSEAIESLVSSIEERFPAGVPFVLMFAGSEDNPHCEETCARVALSLAERVPGKVLLIDSDFERAKLSDAGAGNGEFGLTTWLTRDVRWQNLIARKSAVGLEFMPLGQKPVKYWKTARQKVLPLVRELQQEYQYICVSVGDAHDRASSLWADIADGTFLIVSLTWSSQTVARSANDYLKSIGARVFGCVVTETSE